MNSDVASSLTSGLRFKCRQCGGSNLHEAISGADVRFEVLSFVHLPSGGVSLRYGNQYMVGDGWQRVGFCCSDCGCALPLRDGQPILSAEDLFEYLQHAESI